MTNNANVFATNKSSTAPDLTQVLLALKRQVVKEVNCARVGVIQAWDAASNTVTVLIAQKQVTSTKPDGSTTIADYPTLLHVPVAFQGGGGFTATFPIRPGDECVVVFNDRELDNWQANGPGIVPTSQRIHDLSDGMAFVGIRNSTRALENISTTAAQLRSDDGESFVELNSQGVKVHSASVYEWDVQGYGQKITWTGGSNYVIDNYNIGAVVTTNNHPISPPGPP